MASDIYFAPRGFRLQVENQWITTSTLGYFGMILVKCTALLVADKSRNFAVMFCYFVIPPASVDWMVLQWFFKTLARRSARGPNGQSAKQGVVGGVFVWNVALTLLFREEGCSSFHMTSDSAVQCCLMLSKCIVVSEILTGSPLEPSGSLSNGLQLRNSHEG